MEKTTFALKISKDVIADLKTFCRERGVKYSFFIEKAIKEKLEEEELKEDILDLKTLQKEEKLAVPFEEYLRRRGV